VFLGGVALVHPKTVTRKKLIGQDHFKIARDLGEDGGCGNGRFQAVSSDDRSGLNGKGGSPVSVNERAQRFHAKPLKGSLHRKQGGFKDIDVVDFRGFGASDGVADRLFADQKGKIFPLFGGELFRVRKALDAAVLREDDRGGNDGSRKTAPPDFIKTGPLTLNERHVVSLKKELSE